MDERTPATHIPGLSRARLKRVIAASNVAAFAIGFWAILFPTQLYTVGLLLCVLLPLWVKTRHDALIMRCPLSP